MVPGTKSTSYHSQSIIDVLIIGGGLSGLLVGHGIQQRATWKLLEARPVLGGRLTNDNKTLGIDLGGAWIWPTHQAKMKQLVAELDLETFPQPDDSSSTRFVGGAVRLIDELSRNMTENVVLNCPVKRCSMEQREDDRYVKVETSKDTYFARRVVLAAPPRLVHEHIQFDPPLSERRASAMAASQTWMAGVTKIALVYPKRFWNLDSSNMGLPGKPAFQVYDSSTKDGSVTALTFFSLAAQSTNENDDKVLANQVAQQLASVWGYYGEKEAASKVKSYTDIVVHRWPREKYISEDEHPDTINPHPTPVRALAGPDWDGLLEFAGSEADLQSPGVMEGAAGAAQRVLGSLQGFLSSRSKVCDIDSEIKNP